MGKFGLDIRLPHDHFWTLLAEHANRRLGEQSNAVSVEDFIPERYEDHVIFGRAYLAEDDGRVVLKTRFELHLSEQAEQLFFVGPKIDLLTGLDGDWVQWDDCDRMIRMKCD